MMQNRITLIAALILISCAFAFSADMVVNNGYDPGAMRADGTNADSPVFPGPVTVTGQTTLNDDTFADDITAKSLTSVGGNITAPATAAFRLGATNMLLAPGTNRFGGGAGNTALSGKQNTAFGSGAMTSVTTGQLNTAFGERTQSALTSAIYCTSIGHEALSSNATSSFITAIGAGVLSKLTSGDNNSGFGRGALSKLVVGYNNVGDGTSAMQSLLAGNLNTAVGALALFELTNNNNNTAVGNSSGRFFGDLSLYTNLLTQTEGSIFIGQDARAKANGSTNEMVFGTRVIGNGSNSLTLGNTSITKTVLRSGTCIGTNTVAVGYDLTVASGAWFGGDVSADQFTDRSDAPESLAEAYAIIQSHEAKGGKVDHSKLHAAAWGRKFRVVETGKTIVKTREIAPAEEGGKATIEKYSEPEKVVISEPDQQGRNLSMVISAQALVIADLAKRIEALEAR